MRIGIAADHGGFELKAQLIADLKTAGYDVADFGAHHQLKHDNSTNTLIQCYRKYNNSKFTTHLRSELLEP